MGLSKKQALRFMLEQVESRMKECRILTFLSVESVFLTNIDGVRTSSLLFAAALCLWKQTPLGKRKGCIHSSQHISGGMCSAHLVQHPSHGRVLFSFPITQIPSAGPLAEDKWCWASPLCGYSPKVTILLRPQADLEMQHSFLFVCLSCSWEKNH